MKISKKFKPGQVIGSFKVDGKKVVFRTIKLSDLEGCMSYINWLIAKKAYISLQNKVSRKSEAKWIKGKVKELKEGNKIAVVIEVDGKVGGLVEVWRWPLANKHVSEIGIGVGPYRRIGLGTKALELMEKIAKKNFKSKIMVIKYMEPNKIAEGLYKKRGFKETGKIPKGIKHYGKYIDEIILYKELR
jgi:RimJ/RimL family protein N-acetyltransferase